MDWNTAADRHHERMVAAQLEEDRRFARETAVALLKAAGFSFILLCVCCALAVIGAAIILPFIK